MKIACIGWGSLIWKPLDLLVEGHWHPDGPALPVEYLRQSNDGRLTLVISPDAAIVQTLWARMTTTDLDIAKASLREREGCYPRSIGVIVRNEALQEDHVHATIGRWLATKDLDAVIWTNLGTKFNGIIGNPPTLHQAVSYLRNLEGDARILAEEYVRKTPVQIDTLFRKAFEGELGWTAIKEEKSE